MRIAEGENVFIYTVREGFDLAEAMAFECSLIGAKPMVTAYSNEYMVKALTKPNEKFVETTPQHMLRAIEATDAYIAIGRPALGEAPVPRIGAWRRGRKPIGDAMDKKGVRWVGIGYPTAKRAKESGVSLAKFRKVILTSLDIDYDTLVKMGRSLVAKVKGAENVHVKSAKGTDIEFQVKGRTWIIDDGVISQEDAEAGDGGLNLPCGEVFICPIETSANGTAFFDVPTSYYGHTIKGIKLEFKDGKVVSFDAEYGKKDFKAVLEAATGDKDRIAEFAVGLNPKASFINDILVDEKVLGTVHFAIGDNKGPAYGGKNNSSIHWDLIMTKATVEVDGKTVMKQGKLRI
jgi:leucyl aminopeptidase (aminopeptidase T)